MIKSGTRTLLLTLAVAAMSFASAKPAFAVDNLYFNGGPMRNLTIDLVFLGSFSTTEMADVRDYVTKLSQYFAGDQSPTGKDPVLRYYGLWGTSPGEWIVDTNAAPSSLDDNGVVNQINLAKSGAFGSPKDFAGNVIPGGLASAINRLPVLITKGVNLGANVGGFHEYRVTPYAVTRFELSDGFGRILSHEIQEAMTDTTPWSGWATSSNEEGADACDMRATDSPFWTATSGDNVTGICDFTLDPSFPGISSDSCNIFEPEQYAPISANLVGANLAAFFRTPGGHIETMSWIPGSPHEGLFDFGQPSASVRAQGKPSSVFSVATGQLVYVRGSDNALWQLSSSGWTSLGGVIFGDPSAIIFNGNAPEIFALGTNNHIFRFSAAAGGWSAVPDSGSGYSGPPRVTSHSSTTIDIFAVGENGHLEWIPFTQAGGFGSLVDMGTVFGRPHHTPISGASWASGRLDIFATSEVSVVHRGYTGSWASDYDSRPELGTAPSGSVAVSSPASGRLEAIVVDRSNLMRHLTYNGAWTADSMNPIVNDAVGDAEVLSSSKGLEVFYRSTTAALKHMTWNGSWIFEGAVTSAGAIQ
jgi:hypothetical protein